MSRTLDSRHLTGHALDLIPYVDWDSDGSVTSAELWSWRALEVFGPVGERVARQLKIPLHWGGRWRSFRDGPHWELDVAHHPSDEPWQEAHFRVGKYSFGPENRSS